MGFGGFNFRGKREEERVLWRTSRAFRATELSRAPIALQTSIKECPSFPQSSCYVMKPKTEFIFTFLIFQFVQNKEIKFP